MIAKTLLMTVKSPVYAAPKVTATWKASNNGLRVALSLLPQLQLVKSLCESWRNSYMKKRSSLPTSQLRNTMEPAE